MRRLPIIPVRRAGSLGDAPPACQHSPVSVTTPSAHHALVIGGTGMLRRVCLHLAGPTGGGFDVSVIARTREDLDELARDAAPIRTPTSAPATAATSRAADPGPLEGSPAPRRGHLIGYPADYTDHQRLALALRAAVTHAGPFALVVAYLSGIDAAAGAETLAAIVPHVGTPDDPCPFFHIRSSAGADPRNTPALPAIANHPNILYRAVTLGFIIEPRGSRWLTNDEIAKGIIRALRAGEPEATIGVTRPWTARPG